MRILLAHNFYQRKGGEDVVLANEKLLLADRGHEVRLLSVSNNQFSGTLSKLQAAWRAPWSREARMAMKQKLTEFAPDIVHVHNFFPILTPAIYAASRDAGVPVVQTLHNYRTICAGALLMRRGRPCEDCIGGSPYQAVLHGCYRGSRPASLAVARMIDIHQRQRTWQTKVDRFIALTEFSKSRFVKAGFPPDIISVKPNFIEDRITVAASRDCALFVGRLSPEKGIHTLLKAWNDLDTRLHIVGGGPLFDCFRSMDLPNIDLLGQLAVESVVDEMSQAKFLVMPSECYETFGLVMIEAFCHSLPVIASRLGAMEEIVEDGVTGLHFAPGDAVDLAAKVRWAVAHPEEMRRMGANARRVYEEKYTPETNYRQLMAVYEQTMAGKQ
jgi:glycosyltransferase involved in cell wall biosynthesis